MRLIESQTIFSASIMRETGGGESSWRAGDYGHHCTDTGKIVYARPKHFFYPEDAERLVATLDKRLQTYEAFDDVPWYWKLLNRIAEAMLSRIAGVIGLDDEFAKIVWNWLNEQYTKFLMNALPGYNANNLMNYFKNRMQEALDDYTENGDVALLDKLFDDLIGGD